MSIKSAKSTAKVIPLRGRTAAPDPEETKLDAIVDGERVQIRGARQIELRCGKASLVMTADGKIVLRGTYVATESSGVVKIRGGAVDIN